MTRPQDIFVGREREMAELTAALEDALAGHGRIVMLAGEPGIGKTRMAEELAAVARERGTEILWGLCPEERGAPAYWPWIQMIRAYLKDRSPEAVRDEMGSGAQDIARIEPEVKKVVPGVTDQASRQDAEAARFRLFDSVSSYLMRASAKRPMVLIFDNLHWADGSSLKLFEFMAGSIERARLLVLGTYRDVDLSRSHPLFVTLGELGRHGHFRRLVLKGLDREAVGALIADAGGVGPPPATVDAIYEQTEGNPLFVREVARLLGHEGMLSLRPPKGPSVRHFRLPEGVKEAIGRRLNTLSPSCNAVLTVASVVGKEFGVPLLRRLAPVAPGSDRPSDPLQDALDEAARARLIEPEGSQQGRYSFTHSLVQRTLAEELSTTQRVQLHARIAIELEAWYGEAAGAHAGELARHFDEAQSILGSEKAARYSRLAGEQALTAIAFEDALGHFNHALAAKERGTWGHGDGPASPQTARSVEDAETGAILAGLTISETGLGHYDEAAVAQKHAFDCFVKVNDRARALEIATFPVPSYTHPATIEVVEDALSLAGPETLEAGWLLVSRAYSLRLFKSDYEGAKAATERAARIAVQHENLTLEMWVLGNQSLMALDHMEWHSAIDSALHALTLADRAGRMGGTTHMWAAHGLAITGQSERAARHAAACVEWGRTHRVPIVITLGQRAVLTMALLRGDWQIARGLICELLARHSAPTEVPWLVPPLIADLALVEAETGNAGEAEQKLGEAIEAVGPPPWRLYGNGLHVANLVARAAYTLGGSEHLGFADQTLKAAPPGSWLPPRGSLGKTAALVLCHLAKGDAQSAGGLFAALQGHRGFVIGAETHWGFDAPVSIDRIAGLAAAANGDSGKAAERFEAAIAFCRSAGYGPELAYSCFNYAESLLNEDSSSNRTKARELLGEGDRVAGPLGMKTLSARLATLRARMDALPLGPPVYPAGLSEREVEVLRLIASGQSNQQVADRLFISANTVANHVRNILTKTGCANRTEAAAYAHRHGISAR